MDGIDQKLTNSRNVEHVLGDHGTGQECADIRTDHGDDRYQSILENMDQDDAPGIQALCVSSLDKILTGHLQHAGHGVMRAIDAA